MKMQGQAGEDDAWQREMRDKILAPLFYGKAYPNAFEFISHDEPRAVGGVDTIVAGIIRIDEKIVRWPTKLGRDHHTYALETMSCTIPGREREGWMITNRVDWLLYCFADKDERGLSCHSIPFYELQNWFLPREKLYPFWTSPQINRTRCRIVPFGVVSAAMPVKVARRRLSP